MATLTLRDVSDDLHRWLKEQAAAHRRSLNKEVIVQLEALRHPLPTVGDREKRLEGIRDIARRSVKLRVRDTRSEEEILGYPQE
jgi:plasmid stability protein